MKKYKEILIAVLIMGISGGVSSLLTDTKSEWYLSLQKSPLTPPPAVFGIAWGILYVLLAVSFAIVLKREKEKAWIYILTAVLLMLWSPVFFLLEMPLTALVILSGIFVISVILGFTAYDVHKAAGLLLIPLVLWTAFAVYLNYYIVLAN